MKEKYKLTPFKILMLQIATAFKVDNLDYDLLKKKFIEEESTNE